VLISVPNKKPKERTHVLDNLITRGAPSDLAAKKPPVRATASSQPARAA
jgi:hypothetical protein